MTTVAECSSTDEAMVLRSLLADCGIAAFVPDELTVTYRGMVSPGIRVQVADEDAETARSILEGRSP
jgi:hypothetical protein